MRFKTKYRIFTEDEAIDLEDAVNKFISKKGREVISITPQDVDEYWVVHLLYEDRIRGTK